MADRPETFGPTRGVFGDGRFNGTMQNVVGPTLVAMATKFGLGTEIQSPTGLSLMSASLAWHGPNLHPDVTWLCLVTLVIWPMGISTLSCFANGVICYLVTCQPSNRL